MEHPSLRARFCADCGAAVGEATPRGDASSDGERRQLTVLFCDLVGSTELSASLDPEDYRALVRGYQARADEAVQRFGGHVAQHLGDGLLVYFGWPLEPPWPMIEPRRRSAPSRWR